MTPWLAERTRCFFDTRAKRQGRAVFLHKFTGWPRAGFLAAVFPNARFIHVVRDGRAVANSWLQMPWWEGFEGPDHWQWGPLPAEHAEEWRASGTSFPVLAAILWKILLGAHDAAAAALPHDRWMEVRYEDAIARPAEAFGAMAAFAGLAPSAEFDRQLARVAFDGGRAQAYRKDLGEEISDQLTRSMREQLERRRYPV